MKKNPFFCLFILFGLAISSISSVNAEPIYHEVTYPEGEGPFPGLLALHSSGGFKSVNALISKYPKSGYAVYAPDFFRKHGITKKTRFDTWTTFRTQIEDDLLEIIQLMKRDPKVDPNNIFAVGFSNGGYWASFLAAKRHVNAGSSHYGVWKFPKWNGYPAKYFDSNSNPLLAIHGDQDSIQKPKRVFPELNNLEKKVPSFQKYIFANIGHSWDCTVCKKDGYSSNFSDKAFNLTLDFFEKYRSK